MTQAELDAAYNQRVYAPNMDLVQKRRLAQVAAAKSRLGEPEIFSYGESPMERLLVYRTEKRNAPIQVWVHGGTWRFGSADAQIEKAEPIVNAGGHCILVDFSRVDDEGVSLSDLVRQVRDAVAWVYRRADDINGNRDRIFVSGHSSGGHLAGVLLTTDWANTHDLPLDVIKGGLCASGMFDLTPVRLSWRNSYLKLTDDEVEQLSPQRHIRHLNAPVIVAYGTEETPEFKRQSRDFAAAVKQAGKPVSLLVAEGHNHFEIAETYANPYGLLGNAVLTQMGLVKS
ncbi:MAG: alpha/beta hydrolase [Woeseiaceae bacterium]|nr:alpha/beta hydrolase [Woeseiaceae bacterium]